MKIHRFIVPFNRDKNITINDSEFYNQVKKVLRLDTGEQIMLCDGAMNEALAIITGFQKDAVDVEILRMLKNENEPVIHAILYCSILKRENFEVVVQKATEVGISEIVPLLCKRTVKLDLKKDRLEKIIKEAAEQSGRGKVPQLHDPVPFEEALLDSKNKLDLFFDPSGVALNIKYRLPDFVGIWIGPEGGWEESETIAAKSAGFTIANLGTLTFRAETAAIIASYLGVAFSRFS